jgi:hypothetical protein
MGYRDYEPETERERRDRIGRENESRPWNDKQRIGNGYVGYKGTVDEQPDNPQNRWTDDD